MDSLGSLGRQENSVRAGANEFGGGRNTGGGSVAGGGEGAEGCGGEGSQQNLGHWTLVRGVRLGWGPVTLRNHRTC